MGESGAWTSLGHSKLQTCRPAGRDAGSAAGTSDRSAVTTVSNGSSMCCSKVARTPPSVGVTESTGRSVVLMRPKRWRVRSFRRRERRIATSDGRAVVSAVQDAPAVGQSRCVSGVPRRSTGRRSPMRSSSASPGCQSVTTGDRVRSPDADASTGSRPACSRKPAVAAAEMSSPTTSICRSGVGADRVCGANCASARSGSLSVAGDSGSVIRLRPSVP
jgi:hypothetical protein